MSCTQRACAAFLAAAALAPRFIFVAEGQFLTEVVYVSSAGCDADDWGCTDDVEAQKVVRTLRVGESGSMHVAPELELLQEGLPAWMTASPDGQCLFVALVDQGKIQPYSLGSGEVWMPGSAVGSGGVYPVHASVSQKSRFLVVANYGGDDGASTAAFRIGAHCTLEALDVRTHHGHSVHPWRQTAAHAHSAYITGPDSDTRHPGEHLVYTCDLGLDAIVVYNLTAEGKLEEVHRIFTSPGSGPRHLVFNPTLPFVYVLCELNQVVSSYRIEEDGGLTLLAEKSLVHDGSTAGKKAAELVIHPSGSALYATNRQNENTVTVFTVDAVTGILEEIQQVGAPRFPRGAALNAEGTVLLVAGQSQSEIWSYKVEADWRLTKTSFSVGLSEGMPPNPAAFAVFPSAKGTGPLLP